jgi:hypothetical protein
MEQMTSYSTNTCQYEMKPTDMYEEGLSIVTEKEIGWHPNPFRLCSLSLHVHDRLQNLCMEMLPDTSMYKNDNKCTNYLPILWVCV